MEVTALGGVKGEHVRAGGPSGDALAERAGSLNEGDLCSLGGWRVARGEAAVVGGNAGTSGEGPGGASGLVLELPRPHLHLLEARVGDRSAAGQCNNVDECGVV